MKDISELIGCRYPVIQGAMGIISNPEMVAAVSEAGGYGLLATGFIQDLEVLKQGIERVRALTDQPFGLNIPAWTPLSLGIAGMAADMGLPAVTTSAGPPEAICAFLKDKGVKVLGVVASVANALKAEAAGVDAVIAEGTESGGLQGPNGVSTLVLVPAVVDAVRVPVVAAGGIADSRGYRAALALGAMGVQVGTRFMASTECVAHARTKEAIVRAAENQTLLIPMGRGLARVIRTPFVDQRIESGEGVSMEELRARQARVYCEGDLEAGPVGAGQVAGLIREVRSVRDIVEDMVR
ncbi:MAG: nitronate monooxygenase family protein [Proteobacteria bacterium]|nr:nitronate monooxygenase family protein [Pseudomonadota bacterium]